MPVKTRILTHHTITLSGAPVSAATILDDDARGNVTLSGAEGPLVTFDVVHLDSAISLLRECQKLASTDPRALTDPVTVPGSPFSATATTWGGSVDAVTLSNVDGPILRVAGTHVDVTIALLDECRKLRNLMGMKGDDLLVAGEPDAGSR